MPVHGAKVAAEVARVLAGPLRPLGPVTAATLRRMELPFDRAVTRAELESRAAQGSRVQTAYAGQRFLAEIDAGRSLPTELLQHANFEKFAAVEQTEKETGFVQELENWLFPPNHTHLDSPRAALRVVCEPKREDENSNQWRLAVHFFLFRSRSGEKERNNVRPGRA